MNLGPESLLLVLLSFVATFAAGRFFSRNWRRKRQERAELERRRGESRQVRRARERRQK